MKPDLRKVLTGAVLVLVAAVPVMLAVEAAHQPVCDRACLIGFAGSYLNALLAHNPTALKLAPGVKAIENGKPVPLGEGLWKTARAITSREAFADPTTGEAGVFGRVTEATGRTSRLALRLKISGQRIEEVETLVSPEATLEQ